MLAIVFSSGGSILRTITHSTRSGDSGRVMFLAAKKLGPPEQPIIAGGLKEGEIVVRSFQWLKRAKEILMYSKNALSR
jgi:hypothetical protein